MTEREDVVEAVAVALLKAEYDHTKVDGPDVSDQFDALELIDEHWGPHYRFVAQAAIAAATPFIERELLKRMMECDGRGEGGIAAIEAYAAAIGVREKEGESDYSKGLRIGMTMTNGSVLAAAHKAFVCAIAHDLGYDIGE